MGSRIHHTVMRITMGQIIAFFPGIKGKLQYLHAGKSCIFYQFLYAVCHKSQIFCNNVYISKLLLHVLEQGNSWPLFPMAMYRSLFPCRNGIVFIKSSEMVNPNHIIHLETVRHPAHPPGISSRFLIIPPVQRVAPQLSVCGEAIRRTSGYC